MGVLHHGHLPARVRAAITLSDLLQAVASVRRDGGRTWALPDVPLRSLTPDEAAQLERQGNTADDWSSMLVAEGILLARIRNCHFQGQVILGRFTGQTSTLGATFPTGVYNSTLADCVLGHNVLVRDVKLLANYVIAPGAVLFDCGQVTCSASTRFGNGMVLLVGPETGGRPVQVFAELDVETAAAVARAAGREEFLAGYSATVADYLALAEANRGIIERDAVILNTPRIHNTYLGPAARVEGATLVADCTLLSSAEDPTRVGSGACLSSSLLQWGSSVRTQALVERSLLTEHAHVERHGKVSDSILGPNTSVGAGEVTSCLLGPFVAAHHQSLLIATLWPEGKGNVGYGANVGSNHTSRAPDQEFRAGEGMFLGLDVNVKFPSDFSRAPYTIVACGACLLSQKMTFPFSLIAPPSVSLPGLSPAYMEIMPSWVLGENLFGLRRNEAKYRVRNRARRSHAECTVFRPETVDLMSAACVRLDRVKQVKDVYTEGDIEGLGKNYLTEKSRQRALETYRFFIRYYALLGLKERIHKVLGAGEAERCRELLATPTREARWEHQRRILNELGIDAVTGLCELPAILEKIAQEVEQSKARDDRRGERIIDDYAAAHTPAAQDEWVRQTWAETRCLQGEVEMLRLRWAALLGTESARLSGVSAA